MLQITIGKVRDRWKAGTLSSDAVSYFFERTLDETKANAIIRLVAVNQSQGIVDLTPMHYGRNALLKHCKIEHLYRGHRKVIELNLLDSSPPA